MSTVDIFPTILDLLNIGDHHDGIQGKSLHPFESTKYHNAVYAECGESVTNINVGLFALQPRRPKLKRFDKGSKCLRTELFKYIASSDEKEELYNIQKDPFERENIIDMYPKEMERLGFEYFSIGR